MCRDLELAVPGTYDPSLPIIDIHRVQGSLQVFLTKQRPRKLSIFGKIYWLKRAVNICREGGGGGVGSHL